MRTSPHASSRPGGFTLVELLVALGIGALVVAVLYAAHHVVVQTVERHRLRSEVRTKVARALDQISRDLTCAVLLPEEEEGRFVLIPPEEADPDQPLLAFCSTVPPSNDPDLRWFTLEYIAFHRRGDALLRIVRSVAPEDPVSGITTSVLARGVSRFEVDVRTDAEWVTSWPRRDDDGLPSAARIRLAADTEPGSRPYALAVEVYLPAGDVITSTLARTAGAGASRDQ